MSRTCFQDGSVLLKMFVSLKMRSVHDVLLHGEADVHMICMWFSSHIHSKLCCVCCSCSGECTTIPVFQPHGKLYWFCRSQYPCSFTSWDKKRRICLKLWGGWIQHDTWERDGQVECLVPSSNSSGALYLSPSSASGLSCVEGWAPELLKLSIKV